MSDLPDFESLEKKIRALKGDSRIAPSDFLENELRRMINISMLDSFPHRFEGVYLTGLKKSLEEEYLCYFETPKFHKHYYDKALIPRFWWQFAYAGCNAQVEHFLMDAGLPEALDKLGMGEEFKNVKEISPSDITDRLRRYFIGIGYLHPSDKNMIVHPNLFMAQILDGRYSGDSPFLSRDLIRCPYHEAQIKGTNKLSDDELWGYWSDLVSLTIANTPSHMYYTAENYRKQENSEFSNYLETGRLLVPRRYVEVTPNIEKFDWVIPAKL